MTRIKMPNDNLKYNRVLGMESMKKKKPVDFENIHSVEPVSFVDSKLAELHTDLEVRQNLI